MKALPTALATSLILLSACGRQESVDDLPSTEELARAANEAVATARANAGAKTEAKEDRNYVNQSHGFSITLPEGWVRNAGASNDTGVVFEDPGAGADIRVFRSGNQNDRTLQQVIEAMNAGSEAVDGDFVNENEYRGTANDGKGNTVAVRMIRKEDGSLVTATFAYPEMLGEQYSLIAQQALDSLQVFTPKNPTE